MIVFKSQIYIMFMVVLKYLNLKYMVQSNTVLAGGKDVPDNLSMTLLMHSRYPPSNIICKMQYNSISLDV